MEKEKIKVIEFNLEDARNRVRTRPDVMFEVVKPKKGEKYLKVLLRYGRDEDWLIHSEIDKSDLTADWLPETIIHLTQKTWWSYFVGVRFISIVKSQFWDWK